ncbi:hypothetical protein JD844_005905 [Phrynosoma platyrhinos]|uniref:RAS guanyl releasing protein 1 n=1 Tax=Phrynosoma platyrhinos TaxID=52577 RepID=A0ABQ7TQT6_PHRPL|nr:hypothetical protein JD844_005905 [Phrynosoma platyrhinos]
MIRRESKWKSRAEAPSMTDMGTIPGSGKSYRRKSRRRMTCPNPREINQALASLTLGELNRSCTLEELIEKCLRSFDLDGNLCTSDIMLNMTLTVHSWVVPSAELARHLLTLYPFGMNRHLEEAIAEILEVVRKEGHKECCHLLDTSSIVTHTSSHSFSCQRSPSCGKKRKVSLLFDHLDAGELANHLSYLEFKAFCRLSYLDFRNYVLRGSVRGSPALERAITLCNSISQWVQVMILNRPTPQQRAEVFTKFIRVTQKLRQLQNFSTLMAIVGGLCHSAIARLKDTHALLPSEVTKALSEMTELLSSSGNYGAYRRAYANCDGFKIPIVGVHLKDLVMLHEAMPDRVEGGRLNLSKLQSLYEPAWELRMLQQAQPPFQANKDLIHLLTTVFKNYDPEQHGCISQEDFETISTSFPFSFYGLERDREGPWSREELTEYFMQACAIVSKLGLGYLHDFHEATFKKPTFCDSCNGFVNCGMICHKHCKDQVEVECQRRLHSSTSDSTTPRIAMPAAVTTHCPSSGSEEEAFLFPPGQEQGRSPLVMPPSITGSRQMKHASTQTEAISPAAERQEESSMGTAGRRSQRQLLEKLKELERERDKLMLANQRLQTRNSQLETENSRLLKEDAATLRSLSCWKAWTACNNYSSPKPN